MSTQPQERKHIQMTDDEWFKKYKPIPNPTGDSGLHVDDVCYMFETYDPDLAKVLEMANSEPLRVWTLLDCDSCEVIGDGYHLVNRIGYFITEVPADPDANYEVMYWEEEEKPATTDCKECDATGLDKSHKWPDGSYASCEHCEGYGDTQDEPEPVKKVEFDKSTQIRSYDVQVTGEYDGDDWVTGCYISTTRRGVSYSSSLGVLEDFGTLESDRDGTIKVGKTIIDKIRDYADKEGY